MSATMGGSVEVEIKNDTGSPLAVSASALPLPAGASTEATLAALKAANHTDLVAVAAALAALGTSGSPVVVESTPPVISATTYDVDGNLTAWTQDGVDYLATYDVDGNLTSQGPA